MHAFLREGGREGGRVGAGARMEESQGRGWEKEMRDGRGRKGGREDTPSVPALVCWQSFPPASRPPSWRIPPTPGPGPRSAVDAGWLARAPSRRVASPGEDEGGREGRVEASEGGEG